MSLSKSKAINSDGNGEMETKMKENRNVEWNSLGKMKFEHVPIAE